MMNKTPATKPLTNKGTIVEVFITFLKLGLTSFGGPVAHIGYFRLELVDKRHWLSESQFGQLLAISQFLPGPASSQLGFSLGLMRAGWGGAIAAFIAFTLPSVLLLIAFAAFIPMMAGPISAAAIQGLKIVALSVVAQGVLGMSRQLCPDRSRITIAMLATVSLLIASSASTQLLVVICGATAGLWLCRSVHPHPEQSLNIAYSARTGWLLLIVFTALLIGLPLLANHQGGAMEVVEAFYRAGAMVFGGGHVVLPLLEESVVNSGWISQQQFLAGYGAAQAVPGPMFSFAAYLGAVLPNGLGGIGGALLALLSLFLPGFLLIAAALPLWHRLSAGVLPTRAIAGANAAVVGILAAALYDPIFTNAVNSPLDLAIGLIGFMLLVTWRLSVIFVVTWCVFASIAVGLLL